MKLTLRRDQPDDNCTLGVLSVDGAPFCQTLEDVVRPAKIKGETAIPAGTYEVVVNWSGRFGRMMPLLLNVPNYEGVRIHYGNTAADTEGCILVGTSRARDMILHSRDAFSKLFPLIDNSCRKGKVYIEILDHQA